MTDPPQQSSRSVRSLLNPSCPLKFFAFTPVWCVVPVLLLALGGPAPHHLGSSHLHNLTQHVYRGCSTCRGSSNDSGQALSLWWGGTGYPVPPHRGTICRSRYQIAKAQVCQCSSHSAKAPPFGTFWTQSMPAASQINRLTTSKWFCWASLARANGSPTLSCFVSH